MANRGSLGYNEKTEKKNRKQVTDMKIKITEPYLWLPVDAKEEKVLLHLYSEGEKIDEIAIRLGVTDCDYYAYKDVSAYKNKELEIIRYDEGNLDRIFQYPEKPQTVYPFRPKLHYHMAAGWCNDPCGLVYADGIYHLYHQCNPYGPEWENMHWGHAVSTDLIHWERKGLALCPDENGTAYTGSAIVDKKNLLGHGKDALLFYHTAAGGKNEWSRTTGKQFNFTQRLYYSTDGGETLVRDDRFLMEQIAPLNRDPRVFYHEESNGYIMLLYLDKSDYVIFRSKDLLTWRETQRLSFPGMWECPELFELPVEGNENEKKWIFWSVEGYYVVGTFDGYTFTTESPLQQGYATSTFHAAQLFSNVGNRVIHISWVWIKNGRGNYRGMMSVPCELSLRKNNGRYQVAFRSVRELSELSGKITVLPRGTITAKLPFEKKATQVNLTWVHPQHGKTTLEVQNLQMVMDFTKKTLDIHNQGTGERLACVTLEETETCELHLLVDQEVIEFFTNRGTSYGAVETEENVLGGNLLVKSEIPVDEITYHRFEV